MLDVKPWVRYCLFWSFIAGLLATWAAFSGWNGLILFLVLAAPVWVVCIAWQVIVVPPKSEYFDPR